MNTGLVITRTGKGTLLLLLLLLIVSCADSKGLPGEIATVNGQGIFLPEAEYRRIRLFGGPSSIAESLPEETLREQYAYVVRQMIEELVVCQFMQSKGIPLEEGTLEAEEQRIRDDYPPGGFEEMLLEQGVSPDIWRENLRRQLIVRQFIAQVIRPEIPLSPSQVQDYYSTHSAEFVIPEQWHFIQIAGPDRKEVEKARTELLNSRNATAVQKTFAVSMHDIRMGADRLPEGVLKELGGLSSWKALTVKSYENEYRSFVLLEKTPPGVLDVASTYSRVEQVLIEGQIQHAYTAWLKKHVARADIRIASILLSSLVMPGDESAEPPHANGTLTTPETLPPAQNGTGRTVPELS